MNYPWIDDYMMAKTAVTKDHQADWNWDRYLLGNKLVAAVCYGEDQIPVYLTLKLPPEEGEMLRALHDDILPGYYMNHQHWNSIRCDGQVPDELVRQMLDTSYDLILKSFSRKMQAELLQGRS